MGLAGGKGFGRRASTHLLALEPRMMFDAAAVATTEAVLADADSATHDAAPSHDPLLAAFVPDARTVDAPHADAPSVAPAREIVFIDTAVADYRQLADEWAGRGEVMLIDSRADGVEQMRAALSGRSDLSAIHIVSHGEAGRLSLGTARLDAAAIGGAYAASLAEIGRALAPAGDILVYGCDFAAGGEGVRAVEALASVTHADIAASDDRTGAATRGGDWTLETTRGAIEARTLAALDWAHTLDPNTAVPISVRADSLTVTVPGGTTPVVSGTTGYVAGDRSPDVGVGAVARWANAATLADGTTADLKATVVSISSGDAIRFNRPGIGANGDDPTFLLRDISNSTGVNGDGAEVQIRWELVRSGTDTALPANVQFNILDIDGVGGQPNTRETVSTSTDNLAYYTRARATDIAFEVSLDRVTASGTQNENVDTTAPVSQQSAATFDWTAVSAFTLTYRLAANNGVTTQAQFYHDGDADFIYADPVYVSIPRLDLDGNDSTAAGNDARFTFREGDPAVSVVDSDVVVSNPMGPNSIVGGRVTLTNAKAGDVLTVGTLPGNITAATTSANGTITVTLSGAGSEADYAAAFRAIGFRNGSDTPDPAQRVIEVSFSNDTLTSALAVSRIDVIPVNDAPIARPDSATTAEDTPVTIPILANDSDADGDPLTVTGASALNGSVTVNPDGTIIYRPNANYNGTDTITYSISDGNGGTATGAATVTVTPVNDAPVPVGTLPPRSAIDRNVVNYPTAAAFTDVDGDTLTYAAAGLPAGLSIDAATGVISGTLGRSASQTGGGSYTITVTARDPDGLAATQSFVLTVTNPVPTAADDTATTAEDTPVTIPVLANDSDPDGDPLTVTAAAADGGAVTVNADNTITYRPNPNFYGTDTIRYTISDGEGGTSAAVVTVTVTPVNDPPRVAVALPPRSGADAAAVSIATAYGFADPDGDTLTYAAAGLPAGLVIDAATGVISGALGRSASQPNGGRYTITVTATDPSGRAVSQAFAFTATNPAPIARPDSATTPEDTPVRIAVTANDEDPDGDPLAVTAATAANGTVAINPDGTLTYTPDPDFTGTDTIRYTISDGEGGTASTTVTVTVTPVNDVPRPAGTLPPRAAMDAAAVSIDTAAGFTDPDGDALAYTATGLPAGLAIDAGTGVISGTLDRSASQPGGGIYAIAVTATDPSGAATTQIFELTVTNPPPVAANDSAVTAEDTAVTIPVLANDGDPDGDPLTVIAATADNGRVVVNADGTLTYTPNVDYNGADIIRYTIADGEGGTASAIVTVTVVPVDDAPRPAPFTTRYDTTDGAVFILPLAPAFTDPDGDTLTYAATGLPPGLALDTATGTVSGTVDRSASQLNGGVYTVVVTATDPSGLGTARTITLTVANPAPVARDDTAATVENVPVTIPVLANDSDPDGDPLTVIAVAADNGSVAINPDGTLTYTPARGFTGSDTIRYTVSDGEGGIASATVTVAVGNLAPVARPIADQSAQDGQAVSLATGDAFSDPNGDTLTYTATGLPPGLAIDPATGVIAGTLDRSASQPAGDYATIVTASDGKGGSASATIRWTIANPAPIAADDAATTRPGTPVTIPVLANDGDPDGDPLTVIAATAANGTVAINPDGTLTYTPAPGFAGSDTIAYTIADGEGGTAGATVTVSVVNRAPVARPDEATTRPGAPVTIPVLANDTDADGDPLTVIAATAANGTVAINPDGTLTYTPAPGFAGNDTIAYTVADGEGGTAGATVTVAVVAPNRPPLAPASTTQAVRDGQVIAVSPGFVDPDGDVLTYSATGLPPGLAVDPATGVIRGTIARSASQAGGGMYEAVVTADDGLGGIASTVVRFVVTNPAPVAADDVVGTRPDIPVVIPVLANDTDPDGDPLTVTAATAGLGGVRVNPDGTLTYTPPAGFTGTDTIRYAISDGDGGVAAATVTVVVTDGNRPPVGSMVPPRSDVDGAVVTLPLGPAFRDPDGDPLTYAATGLPPGLAIDPATGAVGGTIARGSASGGPAGDGRFPVAVTARDPSGAAVTITFVWTVGNAAPVAVDDRAAAVAGRPAIIPVLANDSDPEGDPLTVIAATAANGTVAINRDGTLAYIPAPRFAGTDTIAYTISDGRGGVATAVVSVTVTAPQSPPIVPARDRPVPAIGGVPTRIDALAGVTDPDGDPLVIVSATAGTGSITVQPDGSLLFTPPLGFDGLTTVGFTVSDGRGGIATGIIPVQVADGRGADVEQLLRFGRPHLVDPTPGFATVRLTQGEVRNPLILLSTVNDVRDLHGTSLGDRPVEDAVNGARSLRGTTLDADALITAEVARLTDLADFRDAGDRLFDQRWGDFLVRGLTGSSIAADRDAGVMVESVVRGHAIYVEVRDTATDGRAAIRSIDVRPATGEAKPAWLHVDPRGLAIIERGADMDALHLIVRVHRADGRVTTTPVVIEGETGVVTLDRPGAPAIHGAAPLDATLSTPAAAAQAEAARLSRLFQ